MKENVDRFGTAYVYTANGGTTPEASYAVMFSSTSDTLTLTESSSRKVVYKLYAAIGTVVDNNGTVLTTDVANKAFADAHTEVKEGQTIPLYQLLATSVAEITIHNK